MGKSRKGKSRKSRKARKGREFKPRPKRGKDIHHFYWVKKWYHRNILLELDYDFHHTYHAHFTHNCQDARYRKCHRVACAYEAICCYCKTWLDFGKRVPQDRLLEPEAQN